jgi:DNA-binding transcriptional LysR family regulator
MKRLEAVVGGDIFEKSNGRTTLTSMGNFILPKAKKLLAANDQILAIGGADGHTPIIRLGLSAFFADQFLRQYPRSEEYNQFSIVSDHSSLLAKAFKEGHLDIACLANPPADLEEELFGWVENFVWVRGPDFQLSPGRPIPLIGWPAIWQDATMIGALEEAGLAYRIVFTSADHYARTKAVEAGIGIMALPLRQAVLPLLEATEYFLPRLKPICAGIYVRENPVPERISSLMQGFKAVLQPKQSAN